ncbi:MAG TPA: hypothetical protein VK951_10905 [Miltoncostaeaceae bacterium]|nr:hypothetical protein [Miltoncostaeaceae bacterium]
MQSIPRGARLILTFGHPSAVLRCGDIPNGVSYLSIAKTGSVRPGSFGCKLVPRLPQNFVCDGGNLRVRFSGPTG